MAYVKTGMHKLKKKIFMLLKGHRLQDANQACRQGNNVVQITINENIFASALSGLFTDFDIISVLVCYNRLGHLYLE